MKKILSLALAAMLILQIISCATFPVSAQEITQTKLTNKDVVDMSKSGMAETIILAKINSSPTNFDTTPAAMQELKTAGVSDAVILAMVQPGRIADGTAAATNPVSNGIVIPDGTEIKVNAIEEISGNKVTEGDPLIFKIAEDVTSNGIVVIAKDSIAKGVVSKAKKNGMMGKGGALSIRIESAETVDGQKIKLRAAKSGEGGNSMASTVALTVLLGPIGLLKRGKTAKIKVGTVLTTYADENKTVIPKVL